MYRTVNLYLVKPTAEIMSKSQSEVDIEDILTHVYADKTYIIEQCNSVP